MTNVTANNIFYTFVMKTTNNETDIRTNITNYILS